MKSPFICKFCSHAVRITCLLPGVLSILTTIIYMLAVGEANAQPKLFAETLPCSFDKAVKSPDGQLRLALIIGIDYYENIGKLDGAVNDAGKIYHLIVDDKTLAFPAGNVCVLTNAEATYQGVKTAFTKTLIDRAVDEKGKPADQVLFYYAGHGSQLPDDNGDEDDGRDETLFLHDSLRTVDPSGPLAFAQLRDDEFNKMLAQLYAKTTHVTVILDSCHSGSATRDLSTKARFVEPDPNLFVSPKNKAAPSGDGSPNFAEFTPNSFPEAVFLSAARDGESAIERSGEGVFTKALVNVLKTRDGPNITYNQLFARIQSELSASAEQTPVMSGAADKYVFTKDIPYRPIYDWQVLQTSGNEVTISGIPTSDIGVGAEFLILPGSMTEEQSRDPNIAKARMRAKKQLSFNVWTLDTIENFKHGPIQEGDFANLVLPAPNARKLRVRIRPKGEPYGVENPAALKAALEQQKTRSLQQDDIAKLEFVDKGFEFEIARDDSGRYRILDDRGRIRNIYEETDQTSKTLVEAIATDLANHLRQVNLLASWKVRGGSMIPNHTIEVWLEPFPEIGDAGFCVPDYKPGPWVQAKPNQLQNIPLCTIYVVKAKLADDAPVPVNLAGSMLSANGEMSELPKPFDQSLIRRHEAQRDGPPCAALLGASTEKRPIELKPGQTACLGLFQGTPDTLLFEEHVYVLGLPAIKTAGQPIIPIPWHMLSTPTERTRAPEVEAAPPKKEYGTYSILPVRTVANTGFGALTDDKVNKKVATREYTIRKFDISPYLPDAEKRSALYRVLEQAEKLATTTKLPNGDIDGATYKQHSWCEGSDAKNIEKGVDCSRAIWYAFTRAGVPYNRYAQETPDPSLCVSSYDPKKDGYIYTGDMARKDYLMSDDFEDCFAVDDKGERKLKLGDVLVYRDSKKGDGHTVMVIDPEKRIAWGSHGWDGNPRFIDKDTGDYPAADLGVEFQKIKIKPDWERWDRPTMKLVACWRHKRFIAEAKTSVGAPGLKAVCRVLRRDLKPGSYFMTSICASYADRTNGEK